MAVENVTDQSQLQEGFTTGAVHIEGLSMAGNAVPMHPSDGSLKAPAPASPAPAATKKESAPKSAPGEPKTLTQLAAEAGAPSEPTPQQSAQAVIDKLMASESFRTDYLKGDPELRQKLVAGLTELYQQAEAGENGETPGKFEIDGKPEDSIEDLARHVGVSLPRQQDGSLVLHDGNLADFLSFMGGTDVPGETVQLLLDDYTNRLVLNGGEIYAEDVEALDARFAGRIPEPVRNQLRAWIEQVHGEEE